MDELDKRSEKIVSALNDIGLQIESAMSQDTSFEKLALDSWVSDYDETLSAGQTDQAMKTITGVGIVTYTIIYDVIENQGG